MRQALTATVAAIAVAITAPASAQPAAGARPLAGSTTTGASAGDEPPWSRRVSEADRARAQLLLEEGNELFVHSRHREALERYQAAVAAWDHPAIRFNIVRALIQLDRLVEAYDNLELALRYGGAPLEDQIYAEARAYRRLLDGRIAELEISTSQPGVTITLDGRRFLRGPGAQRTRLLPGTHQIVAKKPGYLTVTRDLVVMPSTAERVAIVLPSLADATITTRRWPAWKPWAVMAAGAAITGFGVLIEREARSDMDRYRADLDRLCGEVPCRGNAIPEASLELRSEAHLEHQLAIGTLVAGGAAMAAGIALVVLNRPYAVLPDDAAGAGRSVVLAPALAPGVVGAAVSGRF